VAPASIRNVGSCQTETSTLSRFKLVVTDTGLGIKRVAVDGKTMLTPNIFLPKDKVLPVMLCSAGVEGRRGTIDWRDGVLSLRAARELGSMRRASKDGPIAPVVWRWICALGPKAWIHCKPMEYSSKGLA